MRIQSKRSFAEGAAIEAGNHLSTCIEAALILMKEARTWAPKGSYLGLAYSLVDRV